MKTYLRIGDTLWIHRDGRTYTAPAQEMEATKRGGGKKIATGLLKSPMPGKILKINVKPDDAVIPGQTVCVIEAMKMEYALKAPFKGKVKDVFKKAGDLVRLDEKIAEIIEDK